MARRITEEQRIEFYFTHAPVGDVERMLDKVQLIYRVRFPDPGLKPKRGRKAKTGVTIHDGKGAPEIRELREPA